MTRPLPVRPALAILPLALLIATAAQEAPPPPSAAQEAPPVTPPAAAPATPAPAPVPRNLPRVVLTTSLGAITIELDKDKAPATVANFLKYVDTKRLDGATFYRALSFPGDKPLGLIQGGIKGRSDKVLPPVKHEPTSQTGLTHDDGAISMARGAPGSATADFFIIIGGLPSLDASANDPGYAVFGHVVGGMDVVHALQTQPLSPTAGEGAMKGQMLAKPVTITSVRRAPAISAGPAG